MKKYSADYFQKKFLILFDKLLLKDGYIDAVKKKRKLLGIPENGFNDPIELAEYLMKRLSKKEKEETTTIFFLHQYEIENKKPLEKIDMEDVRKKFSKKFKGESNSLAIIMAFIERIDGHNDFFTKDWIITLGKKNTGLFSIPWGLYKEFFSFDLLDEHISMHFIEKYFFLGNSGVNAYIKNKIDCPMCRHIGVSHFSPERTNMLGKEKGPFSGEYIFNKNTVKMLSSHFNSVFLIIKPYAVKEQVIQYIEDNWHHIKDHVIEKNTFYKQYGVNPSKIKESNIDQNQLVYELCKQTKKELLKAYRGKEDFSVSGIYKESVISAILKEEYSIEMTPEAIKKSASRFADSKKIKNTPKDIRDI